ncbi:FecCD family ABC transporter permease [Amycolatopsis anabasis]|uniref:FecCD family ABC transporter permease n=1 Tax=Amycolatopsis anabasis TaxID=1840409 RepID=UPI001FE98BCF|nr:iron chelate uptake ABC transporter family permease subunit [Amycolatopsis anabasis]
MPIRRVPRPLLVSVFLVAALAVVAVITLGTGQISVAPLDVVRTLLGNGSKLTDFAVLELRLPRAVTAVLVGAALGISGAVFQSLSRNPLGSPDIIGFNYGATTGGLMVILLAGGSAATVSLGALGGGLVTALLVYLLAWQRGVRGYRLVLVGVGVSAILQSINFYLIVNANLADASRATVWITGSLNNRGWEHAVPVGIALAVVLPAVLLGGKWLRILEMGDEPARSLGVPVEGARLYLLITGTAACAVATAAAGPIAFVALTAPQLAKRLTRSTGPNVLPAAWMGALLVLAADFAAQRVGGSATLPVGVATAALGGAYLGWLLWRQRAQSA